jgi:hypothetical protein
MSNSKRDLQCKGCLTYESNLYNCDCMLLYKYEVQCPCATCLIKAVCVIACDSFINLARKYRRIYNEENSNVHKRNM